ncbi:MAG: tetratricopeptide repeat protein, partial [Gammaproteobacteria bacterium]|nr:tetratricopeptide repeat protein [Gammaproteobacteria bacterium]
QHHYNGYHHSIDESQLGFFRKLFYRRVPHAVGFYLAGSWTFLEFFESLISRHNISPHWQDISLLAIVLLFPSILILAYRHGAPGIQNWTKVEKIGIPGNFFITLLIIYSQFASKDLGASAEMITGVGPDGSIIERKRPKAEFRRRVAISFFDIKDDTQDKYLALGIPLAIEKDLRQDPYLNVIEPSDLARPLKRSDYRGLKAPMSLMLEIAKNNRIEYLITGSLSKVNNQIVLNSNLYKVEDSALVEKLVTTGHEDIFSAVDDLSVQIKSALGFSSGHINHVTDLPIEEQLTDSMPAFLAYARSQHEVRFKDDFVKSEAELQQAIKLDDSFSVASSQYALLLLQQSRTEDGLKLLEMAKKHNYRLTDSGKFILRTLEALFKANPVLASDTVIQWIKLYPDDTDAWMMKYTLHINFNERLLAIEALREILRLEPFGTHRHLRIGQIYTSIGDLESALKEYEIFTSKSPANAQGHLLTGDIHRALGDMQSAKEEYQQAKVLMTNNISADRRLADLEMREGEFLQAEKDIKNYIQSSEIPEDKYLAWNKMAEFYWLRGQRKESLVAYRNSFASLKQFSPETTYLLTRVQSSWRFAAAGDPEEGLQMLDDAGMLLETSKGNIYNLPIKISRVIYDAHTGKPDEAMKVIDEVAILIASYVGSGSKDTIAQIKGIVQFKDEAYAESAKNLLIFLEKNPVDQNEMMSMLGASFLKSDQIQSAKSTYEKILIAFPSHPLANYGMARVELDLEQPESAITYLEKALKGWSLADEDFEPANEARKIFNQLKTI